jgi:hypothetical protein
MPPRHKSSKSSNRKLQVPQLDSTERNKNKMLENTDVKQRFDRVFEQARSLSAWQQARDGINAEMNRLPDNRNYLELEGKSLHGEKLRLEGELAKVSEQQSLIRRNVQAFFVSVIRELSEPIQNRLAECLSKRLRVRALLAEAAGIVEELEEFPSQWDREIKILQQWMVAATGETGETYHLPESPLPSSFVPALSKSVNESGKTSAVLRHVAGQIS